MVRHVAHALAVDLVCDAHLDRGERIEDVELRDEDLREAVEPRRLAQHDCVEPAGTPTALGVHAVLVATVDEAVTDLVEQLGGERP